ncbi:MAG: hypothetical protein ACI87E_003270 [Mariniblastus sp.]
MLNRLVHVVLLGMRPSAFFLGSWILSNHFYRPGTQGNVVIDLKSVGGLAEFQPQKFTGSSESVATTLISFCFPHCPGGQPDLRTSSTVTSALTRLSSGIAVDVIRRCSHLFGMKMSGQVPVDVVLVSLRFSGGGTPTRRHEENCLATNSLLGIVNSGSTQIDRWSVDGCKWVLSTRQP